MGLLDDAIRQHLELKRRHGADPSEVARQEQEALGPPRRGTAAEEVELAEHDELSGAVAAPEDVELYDDGDEDVPADDEEPYDDEDDDAPLEPSEPAGEPEAPVTPASAVDQPTQAYDVADLEADEPQDGEEGPRDESEDVLEETPEFLQETPEHDRLWFEQRPPRDFDF